MSLICLVGGLWTASLTFRNINFDGSGGSTAVISVTTVSNFLTGWNHHFANLDVEKYQRTYLFAQIGAWLAVLAPVALLALGSMRPPIQRTLSTPLPQKLAVAVAVLDALGVIACVMQVVTVRSYNVPWSYQPAYGPGLPLDGNGACLQRGVRPGATASD